MSAVIAPNRGNNPCVCGYIHPCCRFLVDGKCAHATPGNHHHAPPASTTQHRLEDEAGEAIAEFLAQELNEQGDQ